MSLRPAEQDHRHMDFPSGHLVNSLSLFQMRSLAEEQISPKSHKEPAIPALARSRVSLELRRLRLSGASFHNDDSASFQFDSRV